LIHYINVKQNKYELAEVVKRFGKQLTEQETLSAQQIKALNNIVQCRTASLGGHKEVCDNCKTVCFSYNSCGDRHCPKCQSTKQAIWIEELINNTLPVKHYHIIFTVPHCLNDICLWNDKMYYNILFSAAWRTLHSFGYTHYGVESGAVAVLHSWGQNLCFHPHIHCIVPAAGFSIKGEWKNIGKYDNYLYPVHQLSETFKGKLLDSLKRKLKKMNMLTGFYKHIEKAYKCRWVVNSQKSFASADNVIHYLGQYTQRVAINNRRILKITNTHVTFTSKDYRDNAKNKPVTIKGVEFLRRFCMHILPKRFVKIRRFGIYNSTTIRNLKLQFLPENKPDIQELEKSKEVETKQERINRLTGLDTGKCPACKKGKMHIVKEIPRIRSPAGHLPTILLKKLK